MCVQGLSSQRKLYKSFSHGKPKQFQTRNPTDFLFSSSAIRVPTDSLPSINFHYETQENKNREIAVQSFKLDPLDPYIYYHINTTLNSLRAIISIRQPKLKSIYKSSKITVQTISSSSKETYLPILSLLEVTRYKREGPTTSC